MDIETIQLTQEDIEDQNRNYDADYLSKAKIGDWVYDDGEVLCSQSCVDHWYQTSSTEEERENWLQIFEHLQSLNNQ